MLNPISERTNQKNRKQVLRSLLQMIVNCKENKFHEILPIGDIKGAKFGIYCMGANWMSLPVNVNIVFNFQNKLNQSGL